jgi:hypothetical protein
LPPALQVDRQRRMLEPLIFTLIFITFSMLLPLLFSCQTPDCVNQQVPSLPYQALPGGGSVRLGCVQAEVLHW